LPNPAATSPQIQKNVVTKHAKRTVWFRLKNYETCETASFALKRNFAKRQVCFAKHETCFVSCFAKYETKLVSLETLLGVPSPLCEGCGPIELFLNAALLVLKGNLRGRGSISISNFHHHSINEGAVYCT
jgi:hypothetical protein